MRIALLLSLLTTCLQLSLAQVSGVVTDQDNNTLPYVNIYIEGTSIGTTTNLEGQYQLDIPSGKHKLIFQYIGYITTSIDIKYIGESLTHNQVLTTENYNLEQITIKADAEDPAYAIIRKAQNKRSYYESLMDNFVCDAYVKGFNEVIDSPDKILGFDMDELEQSLDDGKGVIYLSESVSRLYKKSSKVKEVMLSSKVSGDDAGYSFNSAKEMQFNFYKNSVEINRDIISPIARNAMVYYDYKLEGATYEGAQLINKIKVIPKNAYANTFYGYIYINEDLWNIHSLELGVTKHSTQLPFLDSLTMKQTFLPLDDERWMMLSNVINFKISALGFKVGGNFAGVFSNYELDTVTDDDFSNEVFRVEASANEKDEKYWEEIRPIPLTTKEVVDYKIKDSIRIHHESPAYLDSIDKVQNNFKVTKLLTGYSRRNSKKRINWSIKSPISNLSLNTIQGWNSGITLDWTKHYEKNKAKRLRLSSEINYGLSEEKIRGNLRLDLRANRTNYARYFIETGESLTQYTRLNPISDRLNSIFTLLFRENYLKAYNKRFVDIGHSRYIANGLHGNISVSYQSRTALTNNYRVDEPKFTSNNPQNPDNDTAAFTPHQALILRAHLTLHPGQKRWTYPDRIFRENSGWPVIGLYYKGGLPIDDDAATYNLIYATLSKTIDGGIYGSTRLFGMAGTFLGDGPDRFIDYLHFIGTQTHVASASEYGRRFLMLPYYEMSSAEDFLQVHVEHNFGGYILSKIPILKKTGWQLVGGYKLLSTTDRGSYDEITIGLDNFGFKLFRLLRIDAVLHKRYTHPDNPTPEKRSLGVIVGFKIDIN